mmetsp:Transcript_12279/g.16982  ORF Transcript_12279/g.16982 Transcript_12279/m.16982 type:complete len:263 (+) Transcript_12279:111-899(+)
MKMGSSAAKQKKEPTTTGVETRQKRKSKKESSEPIPVQPNQQLNTSGEELTSNQTNSPPQPSTPSTVNTPPSVSPSTSPPVSKSAKKSRPTPPSSPTKQATEHLSAELKRLMQCSKECEKEGYSIEVVDDNIFKWHVTLFGFSEETQIAQDLQMYKAETGKDNVLLEVIFPFNYPALPPFLRVIYPRFIQYTGHITIGGSVCIKDLTISGWDPKNDLTSFFVMIRNILVEGGALIDMEHLEDYTEEEAREAFARVAKAHGWE